VREFCEVAFSHVGLDYEQYVVSDPQFFRPAEVDYLLGDPTKAMSELSWKPKTSFDQLVTSMLDADVAAG
jgi:GDPmannose 4,6-dehydratase